MIRKKYKHFIQELPLVYKNMASIPYSAFTTDFHCRINTLATNVFLSLPYNPTNDNKIAEPKRIEYTAIWDTGASSSVITKQVVNDLNLKPISKAEVHGVGGTKIEDVYLINIYLPNKVAIMYTKVIECEKLTGNFNALIGMDIIGMGDFVVTNFEGKTLMSYRVPSVKRIDFVEEIRWLKREQKVGRNDSCPCGSGKKYK